MPAGFSRAPKPADPPCQQSTKVEQIIDLECVAVRWNQLGRQPGPSPRTGRGSSPSQWRCRASTSPKRALKVAPVVALVAQPIAARVGGRQLVLQDSPAIRHGDRTAVDDVELGFAQRSGLIVLRIRCHITLQYLRCFSSPARDHPVVVAAWSLYSRAAAVTRITFFAILVEDRPGSMNPRELLPFRTPQW